MWIVIDTSANQFGKHVNNDSADRRVADLGSKQCARKTYDRNAQNIISLRGKGSKWVTNLSDPLSEPHPPTSPDHLTARRHDLSRNHAHFTAHTHRSLRYTDILTLAAVSNPSPAIRLPCCSSTSTLPSRNKQNEQSATTADYVQPGQEQSHPLLQQAHGHSDVPQGQEVAGVHGQPCSDLQAQVSTHRLGQHPPPSCWQVHSAPQVHPPSDWQHALSQWQSMSRNLKMGVTEN